MNHFFVLILDYTAKRLNTNVMLACNHTLNRWYNVIHFIQFDCAWLVFSKKNVHLIDKKYMKYSCLLYTICTRLDNQGEIHH